jgi:Glycosyltransferase family 87
MGPDAKRRATFPLRVAAGVIIAVLLITAATPAIHDTWTGQKATEDFAADYGAAQAMWNGKDIYTATNGFYVYSPFLAFILQPLVAIPEHVASIVWVVFSVFIFFGAALLASKEITKRWCAAGEPVDVSLPWVIATIVLLLSYDKIHTDLRLGQTDCLMLLGFVCVLRWMDPKPWLAGLAVGVLANIKYFGLIFVPYFIIKRNYRAAVASVASFFLFIMLPSVEVGFNMAGTYAVKALGGLAKLIHIRPAVEGHGLQIEPASWDRSISFTSAIFRITDFNGLPEWLGAIFVIIAFAAVMGMIFFSSRPHGLVLFKSNTNGRDGAEQDAVATLEWSVAIMIAITFAPQITARHMVLTLLLYNVGIGIFFLQHDKQLRTVLAVVIVLMVVGLSLPFRGLGLDNALRTWREVGGASWCALVLILALVWAGSRAISARSLAR